MEIGLLALKAGTAFYIMTSAKEILLDVYEPALKEKRFSTGLFVLCRYSLRPFTVGLLASGIRGWLLPYEAGDCEDYKTWLKADRGIKEDRTSISDKNQKIIRDILSNETNTLSLPHKFKKQGNIFYPK
jgi:hypothetical protein